MPGRIPLRGNGCKRPCDNCGTRTVPRKAFPLICAISLPYRSQFSTPPCVMTEPVSNISVPKSPRPFEQPTRRVACYIARGPQQGQAGFWASSTSELPPRKPSIIQSRPNSGVPVRERILDGFQGRQRSDRRRDGAHHGKLFLEGRVLRVDAAQTGGLAGPHGDQRPHQSPLGRVDQRNPGLDRGAVQPQPLGEGRRAGKDQVHLPGQVPGLVVVRLVVHLLDTDAAVHRPQPLGEGGARSWPRNSSEPSTWRFRSGR